MIPSAASFQNSLRPTRKLSPEAAIKPTRTAAVRRRRKPLNPAGESSRREILMMEKFSPQIRVTRSMNTSLQPNDGFFGGRAFMGIREVGGRRSNGRESRRQGRFFALPASF